jgi:hypothetical protein
LDTSRLVGMGKREAMHLVRQEGYEPRIVKEDGKTFSYYEEFLEDSPSFVNLTVRDGIVTKAEVEY